jgi:hypothetical protein
LYFLLFNIIVYFDKIRFSGISQDDLFVIRYIKFFIIIATILPSAPYARANSLPEAVFSEASGHILSGNYINAEEVIDRFINDYPDEPAGPLLKAAVIQYECFDYEDFSREDEFLFFTDQAEILAGKKLMENADDLWAYYYLSAAKTFKGVWKVSTGSFISGIIKGRAGAKGMEKIVSMDSTFYDAYIILGSYRFWKSVAIEPFSWLPFINAEKNGGISDVKTAISKGKLTGPLSTTVLLEMLLKHDPAQAVKLAEKMVEEYPECRLFAWQLGEGYWKMERFTDAVRVFSGIADSMSQNETDDGSAKLRCWWKLAVLSKSVGKTSECLHYCNKVIEIGKRESVNKKQKKIIDKAQRLIDEIIDG